MAPPTTLWARDITSDVNGVKTSFSSWDNCMAEDYCKYPVIVGIIIVSLIALSVLFCVARCACCGLECCCGCLSCCNACCPSPRGSKRNRPSKYSDEPGNFGSTAYNGGRGGGGAGAGAGGAGGGGGGGGYQSTLPPSYNPPAQYAQFDVSKNNNLHADALPHMPSWDTAASRKILDETHHDDLGTGGAVELDHMTPHEEQQAPMLAHQAPSPAVAGGAYSDHNYTNARPDSFMANPDNPDAFVAAAPSPYEHQNYGSSDPYAQQDQTDPLQRYGGGVAAAGNRLSTAPPYSRQSSYGRPPAAYRTTPSPQPPQGYSNSPVYRTTPSPQPPQGYSNSPVYGQQQQYQGASPYGPSAPSYAGQQTGTTARSPPQQYGGNDGYFSNHSPSPPPPAAAAGGSLPGALQAGRGTPQPRVNGGGQSGTPGAYRAYSPPAQPATPTYAAYTPN